jgi:hypothetical protein
MNVFLLHQTAPRRAGRVSWTENPLYGAPIHKVQAIMCNTSVLLLRQFMHSNVHSLVNNFMTFYYQQGVCNVKQHEDNHK